LPDSLVQEAAAGSLIWFSAGTSRCEPAEAQANPWPVKLGSCTLRVNGRPMPLGSISISPVALSNIVFEPIYRVVAQLPYDLDRSTATVEIEDKNGRTNALSLTIKPVVPVLASPIGSGPVIPYVRKPGEEVVVRLTGLGVTSTPAPWGDVAESSMQVVAPVEAFVGGRTARILGAELSRTEVGVFEVRFEVPSIASDLHILNLRVVGTDVPLGSHFVTR